MKNLQIVLNLTRNHNRFASQSVDLIASNSWISQFARLAMTSSLPNSYCIGLPGNRLYGGCTYIDMIEREICRLARELFPMEHVVLQFLSGMQANIGAYNAVLKRGNTVMAAQLKHGGHYSHNPQGPLRLFSAKLVPVPFDDSCYNIDVDELAKSLATQKPKLLIVGWSEFLFPHPLPEIRALCDKHGVRLMYDMSHVAGLIAGKVFQPDATKYADIATSSTGKSLHAPDHGMVFFNDKSLETGVLDAVMPLLTSNTHPHEMAALGVAFAEMVEFGRDYALQVVRNSKALGRALEEEGLKVLYAHLDYSESHTVLVEYVASSVAVALLDRTGILCNTCPLPWDPPRTETGLRLGTQVLTRRGMREPEMQVIAQGIARVLLHGEHPDRVAYEFVKPLAQRFDRTVYSFDFHFPLQQDWYGAPYEGYRAENVDDVIHELVPFANCTPEQIRSLAEQLTLVVIDKEQVLFETGDASDSVYFISEGIVEIMDRSGNTDVVIGSLGEGKHFGELGVMKGINRTMTARAQPRTRLFRMKAANFEELLKDVLPLRQYFEDYVHIIEEQNRWRQRAM
ncbi:MAG: aminotransferase class I/II-fold pyridoxal phosphate-dependent enzyme [Acidiferrobacterales bacterium]